MKLNTTVNSSVLFEYAMFATTILHPTQTIPDLESINSGYLESLIFSIIIALLGGRSGSSQQELLKQRNLHIHVHIERVMPASFSPQHYYMLFLQKKYLCPEETDDTNLVNGDLTGFKEPLDDCGNCLGFLPVAQAAPTLPSSARLLLPTWIDPHNRLKSGREQRRSLCRGAAVEKLTSIEALVRNLLKFTFGMHAAVKRNVMMVIVDQMIIMCHCPPARCYDIALVDKTDSPKLTADISGWQRYWRRRRWTV